MSATDWSRILTGSSMLLTALALARTSRPSRSKKPMTEASNEEQQSEASETSLRARLRSERSHQLEDRSGDGTGSEIPAACVWERRSADATATSTCGSSELLPGSTALKLAPRGLLGSHLARLAQPGWCPARPHCRPPQPAGRNAHRGGEPSAMAASPAVQPAPATGGPSRCRPWHQRPPHSAASRPSQGEARQRGIHLGTAPKSH